jgi:hypothetical protein
MPERPSQLWKLMPLEKRVLAADAFWRDTEAPEIETQHAEAIVSLARRLNFRPKSLQSASVERRARHLAQMTDVSDSIATRALIAYHFTQQRPLMGAFLDALGIAHDNGLITEEEVSTPTAERLSQAVTHVRGGFAAEDVDLYLRTLSTLDSGTWGNLDSLVAPST